MTPASPEPIADATPEARRFRILLWDIVAAEERYENAARIRERELNRKPEPDPKMLEWAIAQTIAKADERGALVQQAESAFSTCRAEARREALEHAAAMVDGPIKGMREAGFRPDIAYLVELAAAIRGLPRENGRTGP